MPQFDIKRDLDIIEAGGFWCSVCIVACPKEKQSSDSRYCLSCYEVIQNEKKIDAEQKENRDRWSVDGETFIHYGMGYRVNRNLEQCFMGSVDQDGEPRDAATTPLAHLEEGNRAVTTIPQIVGEGCRSFETNNEPTKHPGGRPRKSGDDISRITRWRREKEKQGMLI